MSHVMLAEMIVVISIISILVVAFIIVILIAVYQHALADLRSDSSIYCVSVEGNISHLEDCLRKLPWVVELQTEPGPEDAFGNLATTILIQVTDPRKAERELPKLAIEDATVDLTAFSRGRPDRMVTFASIGEVRTSRPRAGTGRRSELSPRQSVEPRMSGLTAAQAEQPAAFSSVATTRFIDGE